MTTTTPPPPQDLFQNRSIQPASGYYGPNWPASGAIPESYSVGGWSAKDTIFHQQTFLGASIRSFSMNGGFGDNSSTLSVELVNDEYNVSDQTAAGLGDDVYHSGKYSTDIMSLVGDNFAPPMVGSPVFFKFGANRATVQEAYKRTFDELYNITTPPPTTLRGSTYNPENFINLPHGSYVDFEQQKILDLKDYFNDTDLRGTNHLVFGGILQSYVENKGPGGHPVYSVQVVDPREILSNVTLILNNYTGTVYSNHNLLNIYGFLEYNPSYKLEEDLESFYSYKDPLIKLVDSTGNIYYSGNDTYRKEPLISSLVKTTSASSFPAMFPITGTGFARRSPAGIPYYRLKQAVNALMEYDGLLPLEYKQQGFGGKINFRGFNYVIDFGTLPDIPSMYYLDFDQINMLDLVLEICEVTSRELFVSLLPVINHPASTFLYNWNKQFTTAAAFQASGIAGIIRLDAIDRSKQPAYGSIKKYIDSIQTSGIHIENRDIGFELSNVTTDKFIVGAQEVQNYFFTSQQDRNAFGDLAPADKWKLETSLKQQVLPYYGMLGRNAVTIPKGFGAYQQILLDATGLNANGVGAYYVATEMELRCALISFDRWKQFLLQYNDIYMESLEVNDAQDVGALLRASAPAGFPPVDTLSNNYAVTVPRSVFTSYTSNRSGMPSADYGKDRLPKSACNPPYGYPLYYKRATKIGIPEAGLTEISNRLTSIISNYQLLTSTNKSNYKAILNSEWTRLKSIAENTEMSDFEKNYFNAIATLLENPNADQDISKALFFMEEFLEANKKTFQILSKTAKKNTENALKVYNFVKEIAEECLGKKFLVKVPVSTNLFYSTEIAVTNNTDKEYTTGPFGFKPRPISTIPGYEYTSAFRIEVDQERASVLSQANTVKNLKTYLHSGVVDLFKGALDVNYNPLINNHEFNYQPVNDGGFFDFDLCSNIMSSGTIQKVQEIGHDRIPSGIKRGLIPFDLTKFISTNGRIAPYVRFDHSEYLSFENINRTDFVQENINADKQIPDLAEDLDNIKDTTPFRFGNRSNDPPPSASVAFVKCQIDEQLYMPPKCTVSSVKVHATSVIQKDIYVPPRRIYNPCTDTYNDSFSFYKAQFVPDDTQQDDGGSIHTFNQYYNDLLDTLVIRTELQDLDTKNVYALITLPGRVVPTKDARYRDGEFQALNAEQFKHFMNMDTVDGELPGFGSPVQLGKVKSIVEEIGCAKLTALAINQAWFAARKALKGLSFAFPYQVNVTMPSPVYPDIVCLPLMSKERCYGPWVSSHLDFQAMIYNNVPGRVEFLKDENLAPWNYDGYVLMNQAGLAQAEFAHSMLLFSERGGFVVPGVPPNVSLGKSLLTLGPLVTNLQVDVSEGGVRTTVKLDLYTSSFGKLQKQKQDEISRLSRERQKLKDERNALARKSLGKYQTSQNYLKDYEAMSKMSMSSQYSGPFNGASSAIGNIVLGVDKESQKRWSSVPRPDGTQSHILDFYVQNGSIQQIGEIGQVAQEYLSEDDLAHNYFNTAANSITDLYSPASMSPEHPNMPSKQVSYQSARNKFYFNPDVPFSPNDIS